MDAGEVETTELATISRPATGSTFAEIDLMLAEAKPLLARRLRQSSRQRRWAA